MSAREAEDVLDELGEGMSKSGCAHGPLENFGCPEGGCDCCFSEDCGGHESGSEEQGFG